MRVICYKWGDCDVKWRAANWRWSECALVDEIVAGLPKVGVPGEMAVPPWLQEEKPYDAYEEAKRKRFIRLLCRIKGEPDVEIEKKVRSDIKITIHDVKLVVKAVRNIDIQILEE